VPGENSSFREHLESERAATSKEGTRRRAAQMTKLLAGCGKTPCTSSKAMVHA
jgi:hypothetical protein